MANPDAFEPAPGAQESLGTHAPSPAEAKSNSQGATASETYDVNVDGKVYRVEVAPSGTLTSVTPADTAQPQPQTVSTASPAAASSQSIDAPLAGNVFKVLVRTGDSVSEGDVVMILEAMKMETEIRSAFSGTVNDITVGEGDAVTSGQPLILLG